MCLDFLCCCCGPAACGLCCFGSKIKNSVVTRLLYMSFLVFVLIISTIMLAPSVQNWLQSLVSRVYCSVQLLEYIFKCVYFNFTQQILCVPFNVSLNDHLPFPLIPQISINNAIQCSQFVGYLAVYRICMAVAGFFFILMLFMLCVCSSKDPRAYIQNGYDVCSDRMWSL